MKKIVGLINLFFGIVEILIGIPYILFTIPKLLKMYDDLKVDLPYNPASAYLYAAFLILLGLVNVLVGLGNFSVIFKNKSDLFYKIGILFVIFSLIISGMAVSRMVYTTISPIYNLTNVTSN